MNRDLLDLFFGALTVWLIWKNFLKPKSLTLKGKIKEYSKNLHYNLEMNRDLYTLDLVNLLEEEIKTCKSIVKETKDKELLQDFLKKSQIKVKDKIPAKKMEFFL